MIRINLIKNGARSKPALHIPRPLIIAVIAVAVIGVLIPVVPRIVVLCKPLMAKKTVSPQPMVEKTVAVIAPPPNKLTVIEEVVRDVRDAQLKLSENGQYSMPYAQLSFAEKINYEQLHTRAVCRILSKIVPAGIGLKSLEIADFQTVYMVGICSSREPISAFLTALKEQQMEVLPPPLSSITSNKGGGYKFALSCKTEFGLNLSDPDVDLALANVVPRTQLNAVLDSLRANLTLAHWVIEQKPEQLDMQKIGNFYQFEYRLKATASFRDFVAAIMAVRAARLPLSFKKCVLSTKQIGAVVIDADIIILTRITD